MIIPLACPGQARPPPPPFSYVGKLVEGEKRFAVLTRADAVLIVRAGEEIDRGYRVQSITDEQVLLLHVDSGVVQTLAFDAAARGRAPAAAPEAQAGGDHALRIAGPSAAAIGEQFSLTLSLGAGAKASDGSVELHFDPNVLQLRGSEAEGAVDGYAQIELSGAATAMQFRVVARQPTATEISVAADDKRAAHRLAITPAGASVPSPAPAIGSVPSPAVPRSRHEH